MLTRHILILIIFNCSFTVLGQFAIKNNPAFNYIEVTGTAEMEVAPDIIRLRILLNDKDNKNKQGLADLEKQMLEKLKELGIDPVKDLTVKDYSNYLKKMWLGKTEIGQMKEYTLTLHDAKTLGKVFAELPKINIYSLDVIYLDHSKMQDLKKEVKIRSIKAAKEKAQYLAEALNQTIGKAIYIKEVPNDNYKAPMLAYSSNVKINGNRESTASDVEEIEFEKIKIRYETEVYFELK